MPIFFRPPLAAKLPSHLQNCGIHFVTYLKNSIQLKRTFARRRISFCSLLLKNEAANEMRTREENFTGQNFDRAKLQYTTTENYGQREEEHPRQSQQFSPSSDAITINRGALNVGTRDTTLVVNTLRVPETPLRFVIIVAINKLGRKRLKIIPRGMVNDDAMHIPFPDVVYPMVKAFDKFIPIVERQFLENQQKENSKESKILANEVFFTSKLSRYSALLWQIEGNLLVEMHQIRCRNENESYDHEHLFIPAQLLPEFIGRMNKWLEFEEKDIWKDFLQPKMNELFRKRFPLLPDFADAIVFNIRKQENRSMKIFVLYRESKEETKSSLILSMGDAINFVFLIDQLFSSEFSVQVGDLATRKFNCRFMSILLEVAVTQQQEDRYIYIEFRSEGETILKIPAKVGLYIRKLMAKALLQTKRYAVNASDEELSRLRSIVKQN